MAYQAGCDDEERLFLIASPGQRPASVDVPTLPRLSRRQDRPVDKPTDLVVAGWAPLAWPDPLDHDLALSAHTRRIRGGATTTVLLEER